MYKMALEWERLQKNIFLQKYKSLQNVFKIYEKPSQKFFLWKKSSKDALYKQSPNICKANLQKILFNTNTISKEII